MNCIYCNNDNVIHNLITYQYLNCELDNIHIKNIDMYTCKKCKEEHICLPDLTKLHTEIGLKLIQKRFLLTGSEIKFLRKNLNLSITELSMYIKTDINDILNWEKDIENIDLIHDNLFRLIYCIIKGFDKKQILIDFLCIKPIPRIVDIIIDNLSII